MNIKIAKMEACGVGREITCQRAERISDGVFLVYPRFERSKDARPLPQSSGFFVTVDLATDHVRIVSREAMADFDLPWLGEIVALFITPSALATRALQAGVTLCSLEAKPDEDVEARIADLAGRMQDNVLRGEGGRPYARIIANALCLELVASYGKIDAEQGQSAGLAPWQQKRVRDLMEEDREGRVRLGELAKACNLSVSQFSRAFRRSVGAAPHKWMLDNRIQKAKLLLEQRELGLAEIALDCGFTDQSHFTRVFSRLTGVPPGRWRKTLDVMISTDLAERRGKASPLYLS